MARSARLFFLLSTPLLAGSIESGSVSVAGIDGDAGWTVSNLSSSDFDVSYSGGNAASTLIYSTCTSPCSGFPIVHAGDVINITSIENAGLGGATGSGEIGGTGYPSLILDSPGFGINTDLTVSATFDVTGPTLALDAPFSMTGTVEAASSSDPSQIVLSEAVSGYGVAQISVIHEGGPSGPLVVSGPMTLTFTPEPGSMGLVGLGFLLFLALGKLKSRDIAQCGLSDPDCD